MGQGRYHTTLPRAFGGLVTNAATNLPPADRESNGGQVMAKGYTSIIVEVQDDGSINVTHDVEGTVIVEVLDYKWSEEHETDVPFDVYTGEGYVKETRRCWDEFLRERDRNRESYYDERAAHAHGYDTTNDYWNDR